MPVAFPHCLLPSKNAIQLASILDMWQSVYNAATTPAMAMAAAAKLPTFLTSATGAAAPVELALDPEPVLVGVTPAVVRPRLVAASMPEAEVTMVVVQEHSEL